MAVREPHDAVTDARDVRVDGQQVVAPSHLKPVAGEIEDPCAGATEAVAELAQRYGGEVPGLTVTRPTLEDVYLEMIGAA